MLVSEGHTNNYLNALLDALKLTRPDFSEHMIPSYRLGYYEIILINQLACFYAARGDLMRGTAIFNGLKTSINNSYADETEKMRMYGTVLYNYTKYLCRMQRHNEVMDIIKEGEELCIKHGRLNLLPGFAINKSVSCHKLGRDEKSAIYSAHAYYGSILMGEAYNADETFVYTKEHLGITFP
jgi:hypothetical protein